jgi:YD repeat-containing protein
VLKRGYQRSQEFGAYRVLIRIDQRARERYDAVGNLLSKTDRKNQTIQYVYDALNRLSSKTYPDSTAANYVYDLVGKIQQVTDPTGTYGFAYDNMGRLIGTTTQYSFL